MLLYYEYECQICGFLIDAGPDGEGSDGAVFLYRDEVNKAAHDKGLEGPTYATQDITASTRAPWRVLHHRCDPVVRGEFDFRDVDDLRTPEDVQRFEDHLGEKRWKGLIQSLWELIPAPQDLPNDYGRIVVRQTRPLTITSDDHGKRVG